MTATTFERFKVIVATVGGYIFAEDMGTDWHIHLCFRSGVILDLIVAKSEETDAYVASSCLLL